MRMMMTVKIPIAEGNEAICNGKMAEVMSDAIKDLNAEASYFVNLDGTRCGIFFFELDDMSEFPLAAEPFFLAFNANVDIRPAMTLEEFSQLGPKLPEIFNKYSY